MTQKLDHYRPSPETTNSVKRQLINADVPPEVIPEDWLQAVVAAMTKWIKTTPEGMAYAVNLLEFEWSKGQDDKTYAIANPYSGIERFIKPSDIFFFRGVLAEGESVPPCMVITEDKEKDQCEDCGVSSHCLQEVRDPSKDHIINLCNKCITFHYHPRIRDAGGFHICQDCTVTTCQHHPQKEAQA